MRGAFMRVLRVAVWGWLAWQAMPLTYAQPSPKLVLGSPNLLIRAAGTAGVQRCAGAVASVSERALRGVRRHDVLADWDRTDPDGGAFFSLTGLEYPDVSALLSLSVQPLSGNRCAILAERISSAPLSCQEVARSELAGYRATPLVKAVTVYTSEAHAHETVTLVDTPPACLIVRRQTDFQWPAASH